MDLAGKRVLITGAGHGLGRALAIEFARVGAEVIVTDREATRADEVVAELKSQGRTAFAYTFDVTVPVQVVAVHDRLHSEHGPIDVLVNNAGVVFGGEFLKVPVERHLATVAINLSG